MWLSKLLQIIPHVSYILAFYNSRHPPLLILPNHASIYASA